MKAYKVKKSDYWLCKDQSGWFYSVNPNHPCVMVYEGPKALWRAHQMWGNSSHQIVEVV